MSAANRALVWGVLAATLLSSPSLFAQGGALAPEGVYIDADGTLRTRPDGTGDRLRDLRRAARGARAEDSWVYVSLPRLLADARRRIEAGEALPDEVRFLSGLVKLQYVFVYPEEGDVVLAGPAEPVVADFPGRAVGQRTGRPVLQLDDLVVALRTCGPGRRDMPFGISIELNMEAQQRMAETVRELQSVVQREPESRREVADRMGEAAGLQPIETFNLAEDTRFAYVAIEADYLLKRHALGLDPSPVRRARSFMSRVTHPGLLSHRFWFELLYEPVLTTPERDAFEIRGQSLQVRCRRSFEQEEADPAPTARSYIEDVTRNFSALAESILAYADLANLAGLSLLAALLDSERVPLRIGWDLEWVLTEYPVARVPTPRAAAPLVNFREVSGSVIFGGGGVLFVPGAVAARPEVDETGAVRARAGRPDGEAWSRRESGGH